MSTDKNRQNRCFIRFAAQMTVTQYFFVLMPKNPILLYIIYGVGVTELFYGEKALHIRRYRAKNTIYCVVRTRGTDDKKISAFLMNFFEKSCCICRSFVLNYFSTRGKGVLCLFIRSLICDDAVGGCTLMQGITAEYVRF